MPDNYTPQFQHREWRDNVDLVSAEDPVTGFNKRFQDVQSEFQTLSRIIGQINSSLAPPVTTLTFAPSFSANAGNNSWDLVTGIASKPSDRTNVEGWLAVQLPHGSRVETINVIGEKSGNVANLNWAFRVELVRQALDGNSTAIVSLNLKNRPANLAQITPLQGRESISPANNLIDNQTYKYIVTARISEADLNSVVRIFAIQLICRQV
jgi:hypothetical protein